MEMTSTKLSRSMSLINAKPYKIVRSAIRRFISGKWRTISWKSAKMPNFNSAANVVWHSASMTSMSMRLRMCVNRCLEACNAASTVHRMSSRMIQLGWPMPEPASTSDVIFDFWLVVAVIIKNGHIQTDGIVAGECSRLLEESRYVLLFWHVFCPGCLHGHVSIHHFDTGLWQQCLDDSHWLRRQQNWSPAWHAQ